MRSRVLGAAVATLLAVVSCVVYPLLHNHYIHPLGRLSRAISVGDRCDEVRTAFVQYFEARRSESEDVQFSEPVFTTDTFHTRSIPPTPGLFLYDLSAFDDLQLTVRCDPEGRVSEVHFVGD